MANAIDFYIYHLLFVRGRQIDNFLKDVFATKVFPRIKSTPTKFSLWWRRVEIEFHKQKDLSEKVVIKQCGKIIAERMFGFEMRIEQ